MATPEARRAADARAPLWLWLAQFVSRCGDALFMPCVAWLAMGDGAGELRVGFAVFIATAPYLLVGPLAGALADRWDRKRLMLVCDVLRAALLLSLPIAVAAGGGLSFPLLVVVAFLLATFSAPFQPARDALLPDLVPPERLARWNAWIQTSDHLAIILGFAIGGSLLELLADAGVGASDADRVLWILVADGATFLLSAAFLLRIRVPAHARRAMRRTRGALADVREGLRLVRRDPTLRGLLVLTALDNLAIMGPAIVGATLFLGDVLGKGPSSLVFFEGAMAVGMLAGATWLGRRRARGGMGRIMLWGMVLDGITYMPFLWIADYPLALAVIAAHGYFIPWIVVGRTTIVQQHVPEAQRGRVFSLVTLTVLGMTSLSALACGAIAALLGVRALFGIAGIFGTLVGLGGLWWLGPRLAAVDAAPDAASDAPTPSR